MDTVQGGVEIEMLMLTFEGISQVNQRRSFSEGWKQVGLPPLPERANTPVPPSG